MAKFEAFCMTKSASKFLIFPFNKIILPYMELILYFKLEYHKNYKYKINQTLPDVLLSEIINVIQRFGDSTNLKSLLGAFNFPSVLCAI